MTPQTEMYQEGLKRGRKESLKARQVDKEEEEQEHKVDSQEQLSRQSSRRN